MSEFICNNCNDKFKTKQQLEILISEGYIKESKLSQGYYVAV